MQNQNQNKDDVLNPLIEKTREIQNFGTTIYTRSGAKNFVKLHNCSNIFCSAFLLGGGPIGFVLILILHYNFGRYIFLLIHFKLFKFPACFFWDHLYGTLPKEKQHILSILV